MRSIDDLLKIMTRLRDPQTGCPWDLAQDFKSIAPYTVEEAYEVADAIARNDMPDLKSELGDLLLQVVFHCEMARQAGQFDFGDVVAGICDKMIKRHPHVFSDADRRDALAQTEAWEAQKMSERAERAARLGLRPSALDDVTMALPALLRAVKLQERAKRVGFDWPEISQVLAKIDEELAEVKAEIDENAALDRQEDELGDLLFVVANLARFLKLSPEEALKRTNAKFERRFRRVEALLAEKGKTPAMSDLEEMDKLWNAVKAEEKLAQKNG